MQNKTIYVDLDDVLCDTAGAYLELVKKKFGISMEFEEIHSFNLQKSFNLSDEENASMFKAAHQPEFTLNLPPIDDMAEILGQWKTLGYSVDIVTGRHTCSHQDSLDWLKRYQVPYDSFIMVDKYGWDDTDHDIAISLDDLCAMSFCFAVEDNLNMTSFLTREMRTPVLLHNRPWNINEQLPEDVTRFASWSSVSKPPQANMD